MQLQPAPAAPAEPEVVPLSPAGRLVRLTVAGAVLVLLIVGSAWGTDADFPFGPFKMYSTRADPNRPVISTRVVGLTANGHEVRLSGGEVGLRRAEFEGQLPRLQAHPELLDLLADSYADRHPSAPALRSIEVVQRRYELRDGRQTGAYEDAVLLDYPVAGTR